MSDREFLKAGSVCGASGGERKEAAPMDALFRDYNYVLNLSVTDQGVLGRYRDLLAVCATGFATVFYNYLFDHPDIAELLYEYERQGGDVGQLARNCLQTLLVSLSGSNAREQEKSLLAAGAVYRELGFRPSWITGAYNLLGLYLREQLPAQEMTGEDRSCLEAYLPRVLQRDLGVTLEAYWSSMNLAATTEIDHLARRLADAEDILSGIPHYLWSVDVLNNCINYANYPFMTLFEGRLDEVMPVIEYTHPDDRQLLSIIWQDAVSGRSGHADVRMSLAGGDTHWYRLSVFPSIDRRGSVASVKCVLEDINLQHAESLQLQRMATTDRLTGLPNRAMWSDHLNLALAAARRSPGTQVIVMSLDVNQFKMFNDTLGMDVGDALLREIAERLKSLVRESDSLARLGGDRFGILLHPVAHAREATERVLAKILDSFDIPFNCSGKQLCVSLTIGIARFPGDGGSEDALLTNAESAMHRAKRNGLPYQYFDPLNDVSTSQQVRYSGQLRSALDNNEFELFYQPQVDLRNSRITGAEALLRWDHPGEGIIMPQRIIPVAEQMGLITPITDWVLATALCQAREWQHKGKHLRISVNVSARSFLNPGLLGKIRSALDKAGLGGDALEIEITEATLLQDTAHAVELLTALSDLGITIAIDDFGTGYSSLSYLKNLPIHTLKIDQSFLADLTFDRQDVSIVRSIIDLGHNLGYRVVAEGVESRNAWELLVSLGCDSAQGFHICEPVPDAGFTRLLVERNYIPDQPV
jgi:diguanylate cyclase (GGDEF)-like protein